MQCLCLDGTNEQLVMKLLGAIIMQQHDKHVHSKQQQQQQQQQEGACNYQTLKCKQHIARYMGESSMLCEPV